MSEPIKCPNGCAPPFAQRIADADPVQVPCGCPITDARSCFTPLTTQVCVAAARAVGIDPGKTIDVNFEFGPPGHAFVVARYLLDDEAMARVLEALASMPAPAPVVPAPGAVSDSEVVSELRRLRTELAQIASLVSGGAAISLVQGPAES